MELTQVAVELLSGPVCLRPKKRCGLVSNQSHEVDQSHGVAAKQPLIFFNYFLCTGDETMTNVFVGKYSLSDIHDRIEMLETIVAKQNKIIQDLWYAPGMPGSQEAAEMFARDVAKI